MKVLDLDEEIDKVNKAYEESINILEERKKKNSKITENNQNEILNLATKIKDIIEKINKIKEERKNHFNENIEFNLLPQKEKDINRLEKELEELNKEKEIKEKIYKEIEEILENENEEYTNRIKLLIKERDDIKKCIVNQQYYENVKIIAVYLKELEKKKTLNEEVVNNNDDQLI